MSKSIKINQFDQIFCQEIPLLDVRAPIEFTQGAFPKANNIALLNDEQRHQIGLCYKQKGQDEALLLGHKLISGETKYQLIKKWKHFCQNNPNAYLYCFRGGMRSHLIQDWLQNEGVEIPLIEGGYKAMRNYLLDVFKKPLNLIRISGQTGVGKTDFLLKYQNKIDLEGLANHRGSAFGKHVTNQPSQINFENNLAIEILKNRLHKTPILVEDESRYIGSINLPHTFIDHMKNAPVCVLTCSEEQRINRIFQDYVVLQKSNYVEKYEKEGAKYFADFLQLALKKIQKRLGGVRYKYLNEIMQQALNDQSEILHKKWIGSLLKYYYDPMYHYQLEKKSNKTIFTGNKTELQEFLSSV